MRRIILLLIITTLLMTKYVTSTQLYYDGHQKLGCNITTINYENMKFTGYNVNCYKLKRLVMDHNSTYIIIHDQRVVSMGINTSILYVKSFNDYIIDVKDQRIYKGKNELISIIKTNSIILLPLLALFSGYMDEILTTLLVWGIVLYVIFRSKKEFDIVKVGVLFTVYIILMIISDMFFDPFSASIVYTTLGGILSFMSYVVGKSD